MENVLKTINNILYNTSMSSGDIFWIMKEFRRLLDDRDAKRYKTLKLYCDRGLHTNINNSNGLDILDTITDNLSKDFIAPKIPGAHRFGYAISENIGLHKLRGDIICLCKEIKIKSDYFQDDNLRYGFAADFISNNIVGYPIKYPDIMTGKTLKRYEQNIEIFNKKFIKLPIITIIVSIELFFDKNILKFNVSANTIDKKTLQERKNDFNFIGEIYKL